MDGHIYREYTICMEYEFDPAKDAANLAKHGISLREVERFDWDTAFIWPDDRFGYDEERMRGWGFIGADVFHIVFVEREGIQRIISLRPAGKQEVRHYVRYLEGR